GGPSLDRLHLASGSFETAGGAGLYTALAAHRCGADITLVAPKPEPIPAPLQPLADRLIAWHGPTVSPDNLPHFEIAYTEGRTDYRQSTFGAVPQITPDLLPADLGKFSLIHVTPLGSPVLQLAFLKACRQRGAQHISAGTNFVLIERHAEVVRQVMEVADYFFLNQREAIALFGSLDKVQTTPGRVLFVTLGAHGVMVVQGDHSTVIPTTAVPETDPTGAGDSFCGATLVGLGHQQHPIIAAQQALPLVAEMVGQVGPAALLADAPAPTMALDGRVRLNETQLARVAEAIARYPGTTPHDFVTAVLPPVNHPATLDYFFAATLQQFSFWSIQDSTYDRPLWASINGQRLKGSEYLWAAFWQQELATPGFSTPQQQAELNHEKLVGLMRDDSGQDPLPALDLHLSQAHAYGRDMLALHLTPQTIIEEARAAERPLQTFLARLDQIGGYKEDPLRKKSALLAIILNQRPENFLPFAEDEDVTPVLDYHAMRACLRLGLVEVVDTQLRAKLVRRALVTPDEEWAVRQACYRAYEQLVVRSGKRYGAVGWFLFSSMRRYCLEMEETLCAQCHLETVCQKHQELFQPVIRTASY
ncbi:MAG: carbohydrate kinase family protein, partial [Anaerolineales bacterium]|nr:carbohydrate kinase family protein [Anaerolineales bacterium]